MAVEKKLKGTKDHFEVLSVSPGNNSSKNKKTAIKDFALAAIVESSTDAIISKDFDATILSWNNAAENIFGYTRKEAVGQKLTKMFPAERIVEELDIIEKVKRGERIEQFETIRKRNDGTDVPVSITAFPIRDEKGDIIAVSAIVRDITNRKIAGKKLLESEQRLRGLIDNLFSFVGLLTPDGVLIEVNRTTLIAANLKPEQLYGKKLSNTYYWAWSEDVQKQLESAISKAARGETSRYDTMVRIENNRFITIDFQIAPIFSENGEVINLVSSAVDITHRLQLEAALNQSARLSFAGELAAGLAHEIKNPLTGIQGALDILIKRQSTETAEHEILKNIRREIVRIDQTVHLLLDRTRPRSMQLNKTSLNETVRRAAQLAYYQVATRQFNNLIKIESNLPDEPFIIAHDPAQIEDAVLNLIINAVDAIGENEGLIEINLFKVLNKNDVEAVIEISDTGCGISKTDLKNIFNPFYTTKESGTGLGLLAVKRIAVAHGGYCVTKSVQGNGSTFSIHLPTKFIYDFSV